MLMTTLDHITITVFQEQYPVAPTDVITLSVAAVISESIGLTQSHCFCSDQESDGTVLIACPASYFQY